MLQYALYFTQLHNYTTTNRIITGTSDVNVQERCLRQLHTLTANVLLVDSMFVPEAVNPQNYVQGYIIKWGSVQLSILQAVV